MTLTGGGVAVGQIYRAARKEAILEGGHEAIAHLLGEGKQLRGKFGVVLLFFER